MLGEAVRKWDVLKKRYNRKKNNLKKRSASGAGLADVEASLQEIKEYAFMTWIDRHTSMRATKSNIVNKDSDEINDEADLESNAEEKENQPLSPAVTCTPKPSGKQKMSSSRQSTNLSSRDEAETYAWRNIGQVFEKKSKSTRGETEKKRDAESIFGEMIAEELRQFDNRRKAIIHHKIQTIIFEQ